MARALSLIELGALDEGGVGALADRLGVGRRQLHRLFRRHLGASPMAVAQTRRVLLAKQLIHETSLPMADVAFASGFGSIRRFNETFQALFGCSPGGLRRGGVGLPTVTQGRIKLLLRYQPPYDWPALLEFLRQRAIPGVEDVTDDCYSRTVQINGAQGTLAVRPARGDALCVTVNFPTLAALPTIIARVRRVFDLATDPSPIGAHLAKDPGLASLVKARPGLRVPGGWDGFELAIRAVLGQQITVAAAVRLAGKLVAAHGTPMAVPEGGLTHTFPLAGDMATTDLAGLGMPRSRAATLSAVAAAVVADPHFFDISLGFEQTIDRLKSVRGVGEWTAQYIALRQLREPDAFPATDVGLIRAMGRLGGRPFSPGELAERAEAWRPWRACAAQYLWSS